MADWRLSNAEVLNVVVMTRTMPMTQLGSCSSREKKASELFASSSAGMAPDQTAMNPVDPTSVRMTVNAIVAI